MKRVLFLAFLVQLFCFVSCSSATAGELHLLGAGSLASAMGEIASEYGKMTGTAVKTTFGSSGKMREILEGSGAGDIFTSANMEHPRQLEKMGRTLFVAEFAQNVLCVFGSAKSGITDANILNKLLDPALKVGIFPAHDPSGEYALRMFAKAEAMKKGAEKTLVDKAIVMEEDLLKAKLPEGESLPSQLMKDGTIDMYVAYASGAQSALTKPGSPVKSIASLSQNLLVGVNYGLAVMKDADPQAYQLGLFILSEYGQSILKKHGFAPIGLTK